MELDEANKRIAALESQLWDAHVNDLNKWREVEHFERRDDQDWADAERYRWLLSKIEYRDGKDGMTWATLDWCVEVSSLSPTTLDEAIDAARATQKESEKEKQNG